MSDDLLGCIFAALGIGLIELVVGAIIIRFIDYIKEKRRRRRRWKK